MNKPIGGTKKTSSVRVMAEDEERRAWEAAAAADGRSLSNWVRKVCAEKLKGETDNHEAYVRQLFELWKRSGSETLFARPWRWRE